MSQNIVYKTYEINTDVEHYAKPINLSGASTVKLTELPVGVKCWISTESTGENKFPLINRGDGWVNLPAPLYDLYIYTEGTTIDNQKILINYTGQNDFFTYGNNSSEIISKIGEISSLSTQAIKDVNDAIYNTYMKKVVARFLIQGTWVLTNLNVWGYRIGYFPLGANNKILSLGLSSQKMYRITMQGHMDLGNGTRGSDGGDAAISAVPCFSITSHFSIFKNDGGATYKKLASTSSSEVEGLFFDFPELYNLSRAPWKNSQSEFNLWGYRHKEDLSTAFWEKGSSSKMSLAQIVTIASQPLNSSSTDIMIHGEILNSYDNFGLFYTINNRYNKSTDTSITMANLLSRPTSHISMILEVSEVLSA